MKNKTAHKKPAVNKIYYIYVGILAVLFFVFHTIPFLRGVLYSFTDWKGYGNWNFVGLRNYLHMFSDADTGNAYLFTFKICDHCNNPCKRNQSGTCLCTECKD